MYQRMTFSMLFPLLAALTIVVFAGGLGIIFMILESTALGEWGVVILGSAIVVGAPTVAALVQRNLEQN